MVIFKTLVIAAIAGLGALAVYTSGDAATLDAHSAQHCPAIGLAALFQPMQN